MSRICVNEFLELNWLNVHDRYLQFIVSDIFKFYNNQCLDYFNEIFCPVDDNGIVTRCCNKKLKLSFCKTKLGIQSLSYVGPSAWNKLPRDNLKTTTSVNCFKHNIEKYFLKQDVSQKLPIWPVWHKSGISDLWSRGVWGPILKVPSGIWGKARKNVCYLLLIMLYNQFKTNACNVNIFSKYFLSLKKQRFTTTSP